MKWLPFSYKNTLRPWFKEEDLENGWEFLSTELSATFFFRNLGGGLFNGNTSQGRAIIGFTKVSRIVRSFELDQPYCTCCSRKQTKGNFCCHLAAVAISLLTEEDQAGKLQPLMFSFELSLWPDIATYLYDEHDSSAGKSVLSLKIDPDQGKITAAGNDILLEASADPMTAGFLRDRFFSRQQVDTQETVSAPLPEGLKQLGDDLVNLSLGTGERELFSRGHKTHGLSRDDSPWFWLARLLYLQTGQDSFVMQADDELGSSFSISTGKDQCSFFTLKPGRRQSCWLFETFNKKQGGGEPFLPPARSFWRTSFNEDSTAICCRAMLSLKTGEVFSREDLAPRQWGSCYHLLKRGFLPLIPVHPDADLCPPGTPIQPSLFSTANDRKTQQCGFDISGSDFATFIEENRDALNHSDNETDQNLLHFIPVEKPDRIHLELLESDDDWCYLSAYYGLGNRNIDLTEVLKARQKGWEYLPGREWLKLQDTPLSWLHNVGADRLYHDDTGRPGLKLKRWEIMTLASQLEWTMSGSERQEQGLLGLPVFDKWQNLQDTAASNHLREYQKTGLAWLVQLLGSGIGGILADEMGLGKTHQALALLDMVSGADPAASFLVVAPASVIYHWVDKIERFYPGLSWCLYHGNDRSLEECLGKKIVLTTYGIVNRDGSELGGCFFEVIVFDEIQYLKNKKTQVHGAAARLKAGIKLGLTGTPMENSPNDLKALLDICLPGTLGSERNFQRRFTTPIVEEQSEERSRELADRISPFFLRRLRSQVVAELPEIIEGSRHCELHDDQIYLYREFLSGKGQKLVEQLSDESSAIPYMEVLALISYLKQICDHPCLISGGSDPEEHGSGKWELFKELLRECLDSGYKVVVFSQYTSMLDLIENYLRDLGIGIACLRGGMNLKKRKEAIDRFQNEDDCQIFCASLLAGGTGIDLTAAQCVIHYDRWWNAAREDQATSRVHRIGQTRVVEVFKLITTGTLEEKIDKLISRRRVLAGKLVQADDEKLVKRLDRKDLLDLLNFQVFPV
ncbi:MAG: DEAD/DEAH box helicase [Desulfuromusa sp.]|jgi:superfamily II DNA or RNA helicase|nr:DEAD/DEAH box helicase [Desulfuromusa sp.]